MRRGLFAIILIILASAGVARAQIYSLGADPSAIKWKSLESAHFRIVYPEAADSLAREYARSLENFSAAQKVSCGFSPNELYRKKMPVILHAYSTVSNGMVTWAPRRMELFTSPELYNPESTPWITQLAVHEGRHVAQMQFPRQHKLFRPLEYLIGELSTGAAAAIYPGPTFLEGDAVVAETALTNTGRGRTADFLEYYHVALADSLYRDFWQWQYGSQRRYSPGNYPAGYMLIAGMRTVFDDAQFTRRYFENVNARFLPFNVLQKTIIQGSGKNLYGGFRLIQEAFRQEWAAADSARAPFVEGQDLVPKARLYDSYTSLTFTDEGLFAIHAGLDRAKELVRIDSCGRVERMGAFASETSRLSYDRFNRRLIWSERKASAMLALKSWSVLRYLEDGHGAIRSFQKEGRLYNPAASDERPVIAAVQNYEDGWNSVVLMASNHCTLFEEYYAPAGIQPVEPVWVGENLFVSGVSEDGFSIYRLPGWEPLFAPAHSKINRLFGRGGLIWFTSDRSGVNELHSVDPVSGELLQRTSLRFGGNEFAFAPDSSLYYSAPTADARVVRRLGADSLLAIPVSFNAFHSATAEELSSQESLPVEPYEGPVSKGRPYSKLWQPFKLHSWAPLYVQYNPVDRLTLDQTETEADLGATLMMQNELGTAWGTLGVSLTAPMDTLGTGYTPKENEIFLPTEFRPALHAQYVWQGWGPIVELRADYNERSVHRKDYTRKSTTSGMSFPESNSIVDKPYVNLSAGVSFPFNLSGGGWKAGIVPAYRLSWCNDQISSLDVQQFTNTVNISIVPHDSYLLSRFSVAAYAVRPTAPSAILPRVGLGGEAGFTRTHDLGDNTPGYYFGKLYCYLPGLMSTHGLRLEAYAKSNYGWEGAWIKMQQYDLKADYAFPFWSMDWSGMSPYFYVRNLEAILHGGTTLGSYEELLRTKKGSLRESYAGATLRVRLSNFLWVPYDTRLGVRFVYNFDKPEKTGLEMVYSMDL